MSCLELKCATKIEDLSDSQILEMKKDIKTFDSDINNILDRVTKLSHSNPSEFTETKDSMITISYRKTNLKASMNLFKVNLGKKVTNRNLSEEKIKNASILGLKLPKFKGYNSVMNYYTFKVEFEKLISPRIQKKHYLEGQASEIERNSRTR